MERMERMKNIYQMYEETINNIRDLNRYERNLLKKLLCKLDPFVYLVTHLTSYKNPDPPFRKNRIPATDSQFILFNDDLNNFVLNNIELEQNNAITEFYAEVTELIGDILPRA